MDDTGPILNPPRNHNQLADSSKAANQEAPLVIENKLLSTRLRLAHAFQSLVLQGYDALLHHGVNYRELPEHKDTTLLDKGLNHGDLHQGEAHVMEWIKRVGHGIVAKVRRKGIKEV